MIERSLKESPIIKKGNYNYIIHPLTDGIPQIEPDLLNEFIERMMRYIDPRSVDKIVTIEAMGIPLATALSLRMGIPFTIIRKREYGLEGEISVEQTTGYSKSKLFINGIKVGERIIIVDDVLSTGGTLRSILKVLKEIGIYIDKILIAIDKGDVAKSIEEDFNIPVISIASIEVTDDGVKIKSIK